MFQAERGVRWTKGRTPTGRGGELRELAGPLLFLASDVVDGGWTIV